MKRLLCELIAQAPACYVSPENKEWRRTSILSEEASTTEHLLWVLMHQYNSAVEPQASMYRRVSRIHDKAIQRRRRRSVAGSIAMYRAMKKTADQVSTEHIFYAEIVAALQEEVLA